MKIRVTLIGFSKIMDGIQNILVSTWECEEPVLKKVRLEKEFIFEAILAPLNGHPTDDLTYLSRHIPISVPVHDTLSKEPVYCRASILSIKTQSV